MNTTGEKQDTPPAGVTVADLYSAVKRLVDHGYGELPVYILYEHVFSRAESLDVVRKQSRRGCPGLFISQYPAKGPNGD